MQGDAYLNKKVFWITNTLTFSYFLRYSRCLHVPWLSDTLPDPLNWVSKSQFIESLQYNREIAVSSLIRGTSSKKLYQELDLESLRSRRWLRRLWFFYKICMNKCLILICIIWFHKELSFFLPEKVKNQCHLQH